MKPFRPKLLSIAVALVGVLSLSACQSVGTTAKTATPSDLQKQLYQANQHLLAGDSFNFSQKSTLAISKKTWKDKQHALNAFFDLNAITPTQKERVFNVAEQKHEYSFGRDRFFGTFASNAYFSTEGTVDARQGVVTATPQIGYQGVNAQASASVPMAVDLVNNKAYVDMSAFGEYMFDKKYIGRYAVIDGKLIMGDDPKQILPLIKTYASLDIGTAEPSEFSVLPLTDADRQNGVAMRIKRDSDTATTVAKINLYDYLTADYLQSLDEKSLNLAHLLLSAVAPSMVDKYTIKAKFEQIFDDVANAYGDKDEQKDEQDESAETDVERMSYAEISANKIHNAINSNLDASQPAEAYVIEAYEAEANVDDDSVDDESVVSCGCSGYSETEDESADTLDAFTAFDDYRTNQLLSVDEFDKIIDTHPDEFAALLTQIKNDQTTDIVVGTNHAEYLLDRQGRLIGIEMNSPLFNDNDTTVRVNTSVNLSDYGKAKADTTLFAKAVDMKELVKSVKKRDYESYYKAEEDKDKFIQEAYKTLPTADAFAQVYQLYVLTDGYFDGDAEDVQNLYDTAKTLGQLFADSTNKDEIMKQDYYDYDWYPSELDVQSYAVYRTMNGYKQYIDDKKAQEILSSNQSLAKKFERLYGDYVIANWGELYQDQQKAFEILGQIAEVDYTRHYKTWQANEADSDDDTNYHLLDKDLKDKLDSEESVSDAFNYTAYQEIYKKVFLKDKP